MKKILSICLILCAHNASAEQIRDMSLSPEETMQQPNIVHDSGNTMNPYQGQNGNVGSFGSGMNDPVQQRMNNMNANQGGVTTNETTTDNSFMSEYCAQNVQPLLGSSGNMQSCIENQKQQACSSWRALPYDARAVLNQTIDCMAAMNDSENGTLPINTTNCNASDSRRLQLIKKYWRDQQTATALVFLPDMVLNASSFCSQGGR